MHQISILRPFGPRTNGLTQYLAVLDNLSSHEGWRVRERIEAIGATLLFLPSYSPDLNPIELAFSKLKSLMRSAMDRTMESLWGNLQSMLEKITASDATNFMRHCGYATGKVDALWLSVNSELMSALFPVLRLPGRV